MVRIAICDDRPEDLEQVGHYLRHALDAIRLQAEVHAFSAGDDLLAAHQSDPFPLVYLDVYMQPRTGLDIARAIREKDEDCRIVFITMSPDHAVEGFQVRASHYLIKPVTAQAVRESLDRCLGGVTESMRAITIKNGKLDIPVLLKDIESVEVFNKVSIVYTRKAEIRTYLPLDKFEAVLGGPPFLRCHRCAIVNMRWIEEYTPTDFLLKSGRRVPIRQSERVALRQRYLDFLFAQTQRG